MNIHFTKKEVSWIKKCIDWSIDCVPHTSKDFVEVANLQEKLKAYPIEKSESVTA